MGSRTAVLYRLSDRRRCEVRKRPDDGVETRGTTMGAIDDTRSAMVPQLNSQKAIAAVKTWIYDITGMGLVTWPLLFGALPAHRPRSGLVKERMTSPHMAHLSKTSASTAYRQTIPCRTSASQACRQRLDDADEVVIFGTQD